MKGLNDDELVKFVELTQHMNVDIRCASLIIVVQMYRYTVPVLYILYWHRATLFELNKSNPNACRQMQVSYYGLQALSTGEQIFYGLVEKARNS
jgi:hypothetical protein